MQRTGKHTASERSAELQIYLTLTQSTQQMVQSCKGNDLPNFFKYFLIAAKCVFQYRALRSCEIYPRLLRASFPHMTPTPLLSVTLARGRQAWPGAALRPPGSLPGAQRGPRYPRPRPGRPRGLPAARALPARRHRGRKSAGPVGDCRNTLLHFTRHAGPLFCAFCPLV